MPTFSGGDGNSESSAYRIANINDLKSLSNYVMNGNGANTAGKYFKLINDIDFSSASLDYNSGQSNFIPIGGRSDEATSAAYSFQGNFDGDGHVVVGLKIKGEVSTSNDYTGFFGRISASNIKNLGIKNAEITAGYITGLLCGWVENSDIINCFVENSTMVANAYLGGICGLAWGGAISDCYVKNITISSTWLAGSGNHNVGALVGMSLSIVNKCYAENSTTSSSGPGGFVGSISSGGIVANSYVRKGKMHAESYGIGAIGDLDGGIVVNCYAVDCETMASNRAGGIVYGGTTSSPNNCYYASIVTNLSNGTDFGALSTSSSIPATNYFIDTWSPQGLTNNGGGTQMTSTQMKQDMVCLLNNWVAANPVQGGVTLLPWRFPEPDTINSGYPIFGKPVSVSIATSDTLKNLKVGRPFSTTVTFRLHDNYKYAASVATADFAISNLPAGLSVSNAVRTNDTLVTATISGTPTAAKATPTALAIPVFIPSANIDKCCSIVTEGAIASEAVDKGDGAPVSAAAIYSSKANGTLVLIPVTNTIPATSQVVEYAISTTKDLPTTGWQTSTVFTNVSAIISGDYHIFARTKENDNYYAGPAKRTYDACHCGL